MEIPSGNLQPHDNSITIRVISNGRHIRLKSPGTWRFFHHHTQNNIKETSKFGIIGPFPQKGQLMGKVFQCHDTIMLSSLRCLACMDCYVSWWPDDSWWVFIVNLTGKVIILGSCIIFHPNEMALQRNTEHYRWDTSNPPVTNKTKWLLSSYFHSNIYGCNSIFVLH